MGNCAPCPSEVNFDACATARFLLVREARTLRRTNYCSSAVTFETDALSNAPHTTPPKRTHKRSSAVIKRQIEATNTLTTAVRFLDGWPLYTALQSSVGWVLRCNATYSGGGKTTKSGLIWSTSHHRSVHVFFQPLGLWWDGVWCGVVGVCARHASHRGST